MNDRLRMLLDHFDIREVIETYVHACDRGDRDATADAHHPDSWDDHGPMKFDGHEFATRNTEVVTSVWNTCNHLLGQSRIKVTGDTAGAETLFFATLTRDDDGIAMLERYIDRFERRAGQWRIKERQTISEWTSSGPLGDDFLSGQLFLHGKRTDADLSYAVLGLGRGCSRIRH